MFSKEKEEETGDKNINSAQYPGIPAALANRERCKTSALSSLIQVLPRSGEAGKRREKSS